MEKPNILGHNHLRFTIFTAFSVFFFFLCAFGFLAFSGERNGVASIFSSFANAITYSTTPSTPPMIDNLTMSLNDGGSNSRRKESLVRDDSCMGRYIYIHDLPSRFNDDLLRNCTALMIWFDMCPYLANSGFGPNVTNPKGILLKNSWFATNQFFLCVIFRNRMKNYKCLTKNSSLASAIFVPFYAGFDIGRHLWGYNTSVRDSLGLDLVKWLASQNEWKKMLGRDHFFVSGRIACDLRRSTDNDASWGSKLMKFPESMNMTMLSIESTSWSNEIAIPYPTYFHPASTNEVTEWQNRIRRRRRRYLFSFVGAPRPNLKDSIRQELINQCLASSKSCKLLYCKPGSSICDNPVEVIKVFGDSIFCLQPPGDSLTRRSIFDSILAGCIPVFFHPGSAYAQYIWHLPKNYSKYSVFIPAKLVKEGQVRIKKMLLQVSMQEMMGMQEEVVRLIPKIIYRNPRGKVESYEDAFDIAVKGVLERVDKVMREIKEGRDPSVGFAKGNSWKLKMSGTGKEREWLNYFDSQNCTTNECFD